MILAYAYTYYRSYLFSVLIYHFQIVCDAEESAAELQERVLVARRIIETHVALLKMVSGSVGMVC